MSRSPDDGQFDQLGIMRITREYKSSIGYRVILSQIAHTAQSNLYHFRADARITRRNLRMVQHESVLVCDRLAEQHNKCPGLRRTHEPCGSRCATHDPPQDRIGVNHHAESRSRQGQSPLLPPATARLLGANSIHKLVQFSFGNLPCTGANRCKQLIECGCPCQVFPREVLFD